MKYRLFRCFNKINLIFIVEKKKKENGCQYRTFVKHNNSYDCKQDEE